MILNLLESVEMKIVLPIPALQLLLIKKKSLATLSITDGSWTALWPGTAVSHFQLNLEPSGDIFQASQGVST